jgi:hypothetical protein
MRNRRVVAALLQQLHSLVSCLLLRFSSARRNIPPRVHRIRPHRQTLLPVPPLHRIPTIPRPRAAAPANEAEEGEEEEEEAETEEEHQHRLLRTRIREEGMQSCLYWYCTPLWVIRNCPHSWPKGDADFLLKGVICAVCLRRKLFLSRSFYFWPGVTAPRQDVPTPWEDGCFYLSELCWCCYSTFYHSIFPVGTPSSVQCLCVPVFLGDTLVEELAISTAALTMAFCFRNEQHVSFSRIFFFFSF